MSIINSSTVALGPQISFSCVSLVCGSHSQGQLMVQDALGASKLQAGRRRKVKMIKKKKKKGGLFQSSQLLLSSLSRPFYKHLGFSFKEEN